MLSPHNHAISLNEIGQTRIQNDRRRKHLMRSQSITSVLNFSGVVWTGGARDFVFILNHCYSFVNNSSI